MNGWPMRLNCKDSRPRLLFMALHNEIQFHLMTVKNSKLL